MKIIYLITPIEMQDLASKIKILLTGADGQLGQSIKVLLKEEHDIDLIATDVKDLNITKGSVVSKYLERLEPDFVINAAAYTNVDLAEEEANLAYMVNSEGAFNLAKSCAEASIPLLHFSSDYVYHNEIKGKIKESDPKFPKGIYAKSKLLGEENIQNNHEQYYILRVSWLYSEYANNFLKTMLRLFDTKDSLNIVSDQIGAPTYAGDLAALILKIIRINLRATEHKPAYGVYNYCNEGELSWYDFAKKIAEIKGSNCEIRAISSAEYPTKAQRPLNSRLDLTKILTTFGLEIPDWENALNRCMKNIE